MAARQVLFRVAAGPLVGFGHLVRSRALARALGVPCLVSVRGPAAAAQTAGALGCVVVRGTPAEALRRKPALLVIDDPTAATARRWLAAARGAGIPVASLHDLGIAILPSDLSIDGSVSPARRGAARANLAGPKYAVLNPAFAAARARLAGSRRRRRPSVLVALGGGGRQRVADRLARRIACMRPDVDVRFAGGFSMSRPAPLSRALHMVPRPTLADALSHSTVAVVGGGVTLYEAACLGVPAVAVGVVAAQQRTIRAFVRAGAAVPAARRSRVSEWTSREIAAAAGRVLTLVDDPERRARMARAGRRLVDGRGASRVAARLRALMAASEGAPSAQRT